MRGYFVPMVTPFDASDGIDEIVLGQLVERLIAGGVDGIVVNGYSGEFPTLSMAERRRVTEVTGEAIAGRVQFVPQVGAFRDADTAELARHAVATGATGLWALPPHPLPLAWAEVIDFYARLADVAGDVPLMAYNLPVMVGRLVSIDEHQRLVERVPTVRAIKDSSYDSGLMDDLLAHYRGTGIEIFDGSDSRIIHGLGSGATSALWGLGNFIPRVGRALIDHFADLSAVDLRAVQRLWHVVRPLCRTLDELGFVPALKAATGLSGLAVGALRPPLATIRGTALQKLISVVEPALALEASLGKDMSLPIKH